MPRHLRLFFFAFGAWLALLALMLALEHWSLAQVVFASRASATTYLALQVILTAVAFALGMVSLVRGPNGARLMVAIPMIVLAIYGAMVIAGPG